MRTRLPETKVIQQVVELLQRFNAAEGKNKAYQERLKGHKE
jgi:hypothetical protein